MGAGFFRALLLALVTTVAVRVILHLLLVHLFESGVFYSSLVEAQSNSISETHPSKFGVADFWASL